MAETREDQIKRAYEDLRTARIEMHEVSERDLAARTALKQKEAALLLSGAIIGKNAETRDAQLKEGCKEELEAVEAVRVEKADAQLRQDLASMRVQELQWLIRNDQATADLDARGYVA
ncbi:MAG: hypothetical protein WC343_11930 [Bacilli bacterium]|jgi:hypothetical protein